MATNQFGGIPQNILSAFRRQAQSLKAQGLSNDQIIENFRSNLGTSNINKLRNLYLQPPTTNLDDPNSNKYTDLPVGDLRRNLNETQPLINPLSTNLNLFGSAARQRNEQQPGFLEQRNTDIANAVMKTPGFDIKNVETLLSQELQRRVGQGKTLQQIGATPEEFQNTYQSILNKIKGQQTGTSGTDILGSYKTTVGGADQGTNGLPPGYKPFELPYDINAQHQQALEGLQAKGKAGQNEIISQYNDTLSQLRLGEDQLKTQYGNRDQVKSNISNVQNQYKLGVTDPNQIAINTGMNVADVNKVIQGKAFEDLSLSEQFQKEQLAPFTNAIADLEKNKNRSVEDLNTNTERVTTQYNQAIDDLKRQYEQQYGGNIRQGVAQGSTRSKLFMNSLDQLSQNFNRMMDRLKYNEQNDLGDISTMKNRMLEDFSSNFQKINTQMQDQTKNLKIDGLSKLQYIQQQYGANVVNMKDALDKLYSSIDDQQLKINDQYTKMVSDMQDKKLKELDMLQKYQGELSKQRQDVVTNYTKDNGLALLGTSATDLLNMVKGGQLGIQEATQLQNYMVGLTSSTLSKLGTLTQADSAKIQNMIAGGSTPQDVISQFQSTGKFSQAGSGSFKYISATKYQPAGYFDEKTGKFVPIAGAGRAGGGGGKGGTGSGGAGASNATTQELQQRIARLKSSINSSYLPLGSSLIQGDNSGDLDFLKNNLALLNFTEAKNKGIKLTNPSDAERDMIKKSATSLTPWMSKDALNRELDRLSAKLGGGPVETTTKKTTSTKSTKRRWKG